MIESLALKYRPKTFKDLVGQPMNAAVLHHMVQKGSVPHGLLFTGPSGVGKTTAARVLASSLDAASVIEIDAASNGGVDQVRALQEAVRYSPGGEHRVIILDEAHSITSQGFEVLLKTLEEPPNGNIFVLVTSEPKKIPGTVLSRLIEFSFKAVTPGQIWDRLMTIAGAEQLSVTPELCSHLAHQAHGNVRTAVNALDLAARADLVSVGEYVAFTGVTDPAPELLRAVLGGDHAELFEIFERILLSSSPARVQEEMVALFRDLLVLQSGGTLLRSGDELKVRQELTAQIDRGQIVFALKLLWDIKIRLVGADDPRGNLEISLILMSEGFSRGRTTSPKSQEKPGPAPSSEPVKRLTLADMQRST